MLRPPAPPRAKDIVLQVLGALPTQREARHFLERFAKDDLVQREQAAHDRKTDRRRDTSPGRPSFSASRRKLSAGPHPIALVRVPSFMKMGSIRELFTHLVDLSRLGLSPVVMLDFAKGEKDNDVQFHATLKRWRNESFAICENLEDISPTLAVWDCFQTTGSARDVKLEPPLQFQPESIRTAVRLGQIPILLPTAITKENIFVPVESKVLLHTLCSSLSATSGLNSKSEPPSASRYSELTPPVKVILANERGGLTTATNEPVHFVNLEQDAGDLAESILKSKDTPNSQQQQQIEELELAQTVLSVLPSSCSAIITSASASKHLVANLITDKPLVSASLQNLALHDFSQSPTVSPPSTLSNSVSRAIDVPTILRSGLRVHSFRNIDDPGLNIPKLTALLESSFRKRLHADSFYERIRSVVDQIVVAGDYDGVTIVTLEHPQQQISKAGIPYLDKIAVAPTSQGIGVADILWNRLVKDYRDLSWRSRNDNPANKWYFERSNGNLVLLGGYWRLFWYGPRGVCEINAYREVAANIPASFASKT